MDQKRAEQALGAAAALTAAGAAAVAGKAGVERVKRRRRLAPEYGMRAGEPGDEAITRIVQAQLDAAIARLEGETSEDRGTAVHEARKSFKRARAALRLARPQLGDEAYRRENALLRDAGRRLAGARDAQVVLETLDGLCERHGDELDVAELRRALAERHEAAAEQLAGDDAAIAAVVEELRGLRERAGAWTFEADDLSALAPGFERIHRRGRRAFRRARDEPTTESLHDASRARWRGGSGA